MNHYASERHGKWRDDEAHLTRIVNKEPTLLLTMSHGGARTRQEWHDAALLNEERTLLDRHHDNKKEENEDLWYLDNGASNHMSGHRVKFQELNEAVIGRVRLSDGPTVQILGKGIVMFTYKNGD